MPVKFVIFKGINYQYYSILMCTFILSKHEHLTFEFNGIEFNLEMFWYQTQRLQFPSQDNLMDEPTSTEMKWDLVEWEF